MFALLRHYNLLLAEDHHLKQPLYTSAKRRQASAYHVIEVASLNGHAHMVPNFADASGHQFWWDRVDWELLG